MPRVALTDRFVAHAKALSGERTDYFDEITTGMTLRVAITGHKAWCYHFTASNGRRARLKLGTYPATSLSAARARALEAAGHTEAGLDPRDKFAAQEAAAMTVKGLVERYLDHPDKQRLKTHDELKRRLEKNVVPTIGEVRLADLHRRDVNRCLDPILKRERPTEATRVFEDVRAMLRWAVRHGDLDHNPVEAMKKPAAAAPRTRVLIPQEIKTLWGGLPTALGRSKTCQRIIKLCLVTAQRVGEVAGMAVGELELEHGIWRLPAPRVKNQHEHVVPLSNLAISIIQEAMEDAGQRPKFIFPSGDGSFSPAAVARTIVRANETIEDRPLGRFNIASWSAHDLRRTALSAMASLGVLPIVIGHVANHRSVTKANVTFLHYVQYSFQREMRQALDLWAAHLEAILSDCSAAKVLPFMEAV